MMIPPGQQVGLGLLPVGPQPCGQCFHRHSVDAGGSSIAFHSLPCGEHVLTRKDAGHQFGEVVVCVLPSHVDAPGSVTAVGLVAAIPRPGVFRTPPRWVAGGI